MASAFRSSTALVLVFGVAVLCSVTPVQGWSKEGHILTCRIAQNLLEAGPAHAVKNLLPDYVKGDLSVLCVWPDQIRYWYKYRWTSPLHYIDTPDQACSYEYDRDCHDQHGLKDMCVDGAIQNFTSQLQHYSEGISDPRHNMTEALLFLSHFVGDIHQIILTALKEYYDKDLDLLQEDLEKNITNGLWKDDISSWTECNDLLACPHTYASESIELACKYGYEGVKSGVTLSEEYFDTRMPIVMKRIVQGGLRLAMILNRIFSENHADVAAT
ncbi:hypothetical protein F2Q70_00041867 [Brassica cretica]|uniref:Aspergillus nuclease S1 n=1 Tax=Brassica cretica TaxID=69181 RepID=A0A8S9K7Y1_BRACR|nr:hypothetical protein F2Q70_00041867 [Brassica cretica]